MLWVTWRQHRTQILVTVGLLAGLGIVLLVHGLRNADLVSRLAADRDALLHLLRDRYQTVTAVINWLPLAPAAIGLFWGAPVLAREFERGTHKLAWTQSVSRGRWLAMKLGGLAAVVTLAGLACGLMISAWLSSFEGTHFTDRFSQPPLYVMSGVLPAAWWLFAFAVGVAAGAVFRRTLAAFGVTLVVVVAAILGFFFFNVRDHYATPQQIVADQDQELALANTGDIQILDERFVDATGREIPPEVALSSCVSTPGAPCRTGGDIRRIILYHPASLYWRFQWTEAGILLAAALVLGGVAVYRASRRVV